MRKFVSMLPALALVVAMVTAGFGCNGVTSESGSAVPPVKPGLPQDLTYSAEVRGEAPNILRLAFSSAEITSLEFKGSSAFKLSVGGVFPSSLSNEKSPNGILGIGFADDAPNTALLLLDGNISAEDGNLTLEYSSSSKKEIFINDEGSGAFSVPVTYLVLEGVPPAPDPSIEAPKVTGAAVFDNAPKNVHVTFDQTLIVTSANGFSVEVNGELQSEIIEYSISRSGIMLTLKYGLVYGDYAVLSYTKSDSEPIVSSELKALDSFSDKNIDNSVAEGTDPNGNIGSALTGLQVLLPRTNWNVGENLISDLTVLANYADSHSDVISAGYTVYPLDPTAAAGNNQKVTVSYLGRTGSITINVKAAGAALPAFAGLNVSVPRKNWAVGEQFTPNVIAVYSDSSYGTILSGYETSPAQPTATEGTDLAVTVSYTIGTVTKSGSVTINVKPENELPSITITSLSASVEKSTWIHNEAFRINVFATYSDGSSGSVPSGYTLNPTVPTSRLGKEQPVMVNYGGKTSSTLSIDVVSAQDAPVTVSALAASATKPAWILNEPLTLTVAATYSDGRSQTISKGYYIKNPEYPTIATGSVTVTVVYMGFEAYFDIKVVENADFLEPLTSITAYSVKDEYYFKETPQIVVNAFYGDSTKPHAVPDTKWTSVPADITGTGTGLVPVKISYTDGTETCSAEFDVTVNEIVIGSGGAGGEQMCSLTPFVDAPAVNGTPDTQGVDNLYYTISDITWRNGTANHTGTFDYSTVYTAQAKLTVKTGYTLNGFAGFTHSTGNVSYDASSKTITITFPSTADRIIIGSANGGGTAALNLTEYVTKPKVGATPDTTGGDNTYFTVSNPVWKNGSTAHTAAFDVNIAYNATVTITPKPGYTLTGFTGSFTHDNAAAGGVIYDAAAKTVTITFPATQYERSANGSLMETFLVTGTNSAAVTNAFNKISAFIKVAKTREAILAGIQLGDYIDLPSLTVAAYSGYGGINQTNAALGYDADFKQDKGTKLRIIVVGINSFNNRSSQPSGYTDTPHVVFQFKNLPSSQILFGITADVSSYDKSIMRKYLTTEDSGSGNFLTGLKNAGVPAGVLWAPKRNLAINYYDKAGASCLVLADLLWLPTEREVHGGGGNSAESETEANQARLEYYDSDAKRGKYDMGGASGSWWVASRSSYVVSMLGQNINYFYAHIALNGTASWASYTQVAADDGVAPAFCVK